MKDYANFSVNDFVLDHDFHKWVTAPDERASAFWTKFLSDHPEKVEEIDEARRLLAHLEFKNYSLTEEQITQLWSKVRGAHTVASPPKHSMRLWYKVAASFIIFGLAALTYFFWNNASLLEYNTAYGETKSIVLPDSSTVILNSNSTLRFSNTWEDDAVRQIWLDGEAYFSVTHTVDHKPFRVNTDEGVAIEVLGTTFNVYHRTEQTKVVLNTGKIRLHLPEKSATQNITMQPGDFVEYKQKTFSKKVVNPKIYTAWTENKIILDHTSLREMIELVRDNYGVEVQVSKDTLLKQTVSGSMPVTDADGVIHQIAQTFQLKVSKKRNKYLMYE